MKKEDREFKSPNQRRINSVLNTARSHKEIKRHRVSQESTKGFDFINNRNVNDEPIFYFQYKHENKEKNIEQTKAEEVVNSDVSTIHEPAIEETIATSDKNVEIEPISIENNVEIEPITNENNVETNPIEDSPIQEATSFEDLYDQNQKEIVVDKKEIDNIEKARLELQKEIEQIRPTELSKPEPTKYSTYIHEEIQEPVTGPVTETKKEKKENKWFTKLKKEKVDKPIKVKEPKTKKEKEPKPIKVKESKPTKEKEPRPKGSKLTFSFAIIVSVILCLGIIGAIGAGIFASKLCEDMPDLVVSDLIAPDSSTIYDNEGNKIMQVGMYLRENIEYDEMPNCLIDAFLSIEDSRFFEHFGVDIPRFTKSAISYVANGGEFAQGGSTITMQLIKNTYFTIDDGENSTIASREGMSGIKRKMQEIVLSSELELLTDTQKKDIIAMYINKVNFGDNIRGVEKAAAYYFGKSAKQLNLNESAFLAGIVNSPASYNPYGNIFKKTSVYYDEDTDYLASGTERRNEVLNLMVQHGYITEKEAKLAKSVKLEDMLVGASNDFNSTNEKYQWYIDAVIDEVEEMTGESPYNVGMNIYTNMNPYMQAYLYDVQNEEDYTGITFPNELCQSAVVLMDNQTGAVEALGGGRGEIDSARKFNRATSAYLNPGSSMKPVVDYSLAIEKLGWATSHTITDQPYYLYDGNILVSNFDHTYYGDMLMTEALGRSQNTPAVQTLVAVVDEIGEDGVVDYLNSIGFNFEYEDFDLQFAIGGNRCLVTPEQLAGAHAIFMNGGMYIKPHTINYIEYVDGRENYVADTVGTRALSPETAWMTAYLERYNMEGSFSSLMWYCKRDYPLYGKTGTTDWADAGVDFGIPVSSTKDSWLVMQTNRYTISCWTGYDELQRGAYFTNAEYQENTKSKIVSALLDQLEEHASYTEYDPYVEMDVPDGVVKIEHVRGTYPYARSGGEMISGYTSKAALEKVPQGTIEDAMAYSNSIKKYVDAGVYNLGGTYDGHVVDVSFSIEAHEGGLISGESVDLSSSNVYGETTQAVGRVWFPHWNTIYLGAATPPFNFSIKIGDDVVVQGSTDTTGFTAEVPEASSVQACVWSTGSGETCVEIPRG